MTPSLNRVVLSLPSLLSLAATTNTGGAPRSFVQLARTGAFQSSRYGKFSITRDDLRQMLHNFKHVTPQPPTELPIDFDHLSMDPQRPGDGIAAGWLKQVELRADGDELWGEVEWTPEAAGFIKNRAYRFISPSFVKDYTHKDGTKIGTTLLAAALTNHPFLESMQAVTLYSFSAMGDLALDAADASATTPVPTAKEETAMNTTDQVIEKKAAAFALRVTTLAKRHPMRDAINLATAEDGAGAAAYRLAGLGADEAAAAEATPLSLSVRAGETFDELAMRYATEKSVSLRQAVHEVSKARPDLAAAR
jgi:phage I-like protein